MGNCPTTSPQESPCGDFSGTGKGPCSMANCYTMAMFCQSEIFAEFVLFMCIYIYR